MEKINATQYARELVDQMSEDDIRCFVTERWREGVINNLAATDPEGLDESVTVDAVLQAMDLEIGQLVQAEELAVTQGPKPVGGEW